LVSGNYPEALEHAGLSETALSKSLSNEHWITAVARQIHGATLHASGDFAAAEVLLLSSYQQLAADPGAKPAYVDKGLERLIALYRDWGKTAMAQKYLDIQARTAGSG
jgi:hypothetical protein